MRLSLSLFLPSPRKFLEAWAWACFFLEGRLSRKFSLDSPWGKREDFHRQVGASCCGVCVSLVGFFPQGSIALGLQPHWGFGIPPPTPSSTPLPLTKADLPLASVGVLWESGEGWTSGSLLRGVSPDGDCGFGAHFYQAFLLVVRPSR